MTQIRLFDALQDWDDTVCQKASRKSSGRNILSGQRRLTRSTTPKVNGSALQQKILRTVQKTPEVMVKISGGGKNMRHIQAHMAYISRRGEVELEDEQGDRYQGKEGLQDVRTMWSRGGVGVPERSEKRKEAFNIVLSMPPGTDPSSVLDAARAFAQAQFHDHQYVFAAHHDEAHPHVHLCVKATSHHGLRLNPRKGDLQVWREQFAEKLCEHGIAANATPRRTRGIVQKAEKQVLRHIDTEFQQGKRSTPCLARQAQRKAALQDVDLTQHPLNPAHDQIVAQRYNVQKAYGHVAKALAQGDQQDKELALKIVHFAQTMPPVRTQHDALVHSLKMDHQKTLNHAKAPQESQQIHSPLEQTR